jgi:alpha-tubulin suppressor-like RCC1 family protein
VFTELVSTHYGGQPSLCGLTLAGAALCWGANNLGQLGDGSGVERIAPVPVAGNHTFVALAASSGTVCGLDTDARTWCWGVNRSGILGDPAGYGSCYVGPRTYPSHVRCSLAPVPVARGHAFAGLALYGSGMACGTTDEASLLCWGAVADGPEVCGLEENSYYTCSFEPMRQPRLESYRAFDVHGATCGVQASGDVYCWGVNQRGILGNGWVLTGEEEPARVRGGLVLETVDVGFSTACGLAPGGTAWCWGEGRSGETGDGRPPFEATPVGVRGVSFAVPGA